MIITQKEIQTLMDAPMKDTYHELVRDLFVFSGVFGREEPHRRPPANIL